MLLTNCGSLFCFALCALGSPLCQDTNFPFFDATPFSFAEFKHLALRWYKFPRWSLWFSWQGPGERFWHFVNHLFTAPTTNYTEERKASQIFYHEGPGCSALAPCPPQASQLLLTQLPAATWVLPRPRLLHPHWACLDSAGSGKLVGTQPSCPRWRGPVLTWVDCTLLGRSSLWLKKLKTNQSDVWT